MPSRRRHTSATAPAFSAVSRNPGDGRRGAVDEETHGVVTQQRLGRLCPCVGRRDGERRDLPGDLTGKAQLLPNSWPGLRTWGHSRRRASARRAHASSRCSQLSSMSSRRRERSASCSAPTGSRPALCTPSAAATAAATSPGSDTGARSANQTPCGDAGRRPSRRLEGEAGLADASGAGQRHQPVRREEDAHRRHLRFAADERGQGVREVVPAPADRLLHRRGRTEVVALLVVELERLRQQLERVRAGPLSAPLEGADRVPAHPGALGQLLLGEVPRLPVAPQQVAGVRRQPRGAGGVAGVLARCRGASVVVGHVSRLRPHRRSRRAGCLGAVLPRGHGGRRSAPSIPVAAGAEAPFGARLAANSPSTLRVPPTGLR